jgi:hypothetical protein
VQVGVADPRRRHLHENFTVARGGDIDVAHLQRLARLEQDGSPCLLGRTLAGAAGLDEPDGTAGL